jgi:hypothetical protein
MVHEHGLVADRELRPGPTPFAGCSVFAFRTTKMPECILHVDRAGGILVACDALQNLQAPDDYFSDQSRQMMQEMGFFQPANLGPVWVQVNEPKARDFVRLQELSFRTALRWPASARYRQGGIRGEVPTRVWRRLTAR